MCQRGDGGRLSHGEVTFDFPKMPALWNCLSEGLAGGPAVAGFPVWAGPLRPPDFPVQAGALAAQTGPEGDSSP